MGVSAVCGQGGGMVVSPAPTQKQHNVAHCSSNARCKFESGIGSERINGSNRLLDKGPLCSGPGEASGRIGPPPCKRPAGPSPTVSVDSKFRKQNIVKTVSTTFSATYIRQWACVTKIAPSSYRVNPASWAGVFSVVFQRLKPIHCQMFQLFERIEEPEPQTCEPEPQTWYQ